MSKESLRDALRAIEPKSKKARVAAYLDEIDSLLAAGVRHPEIAEVLSAHGIDIKPVTLRNLLADIRRSVRRRKAKSRANGEAVPRDGAVSPAVSPAAAPVPLSVSQSRSSPAAAPVATPMLPTARSRVPVQPVASESDDPFSEEARYLSAAAAKKREGNKR